MLHTPRAGRPPTASRPDSRGAPGTVTGAAAPAATEGAQGHRRRWLALAVAVGVAALTCAVVLASAGAVNIVSLPGLAVPDPVVGWLPPAARLVMDLAAVATVGCLLAAVVLVPGGRDLSAPGYRWLRSAYWSALVWSVAAALTLPAQLADVLGTSPDQLSARAVASFASDIPQGQAQLAVAVLAAVIAIGCRFVLRTAGAAAMLGLALVTALPPVFTGHAAGAGSHQAAVTALAIHVVGVLLWSGGLVALLLARKLPTPVLAAAAGRYSRAAPALVVAVGGSGVLTAMTRLSSPVQLAATGYGRLLLLKGAALLGLVLLGWWHRRRTLPPLAAGRPGSFIRLAGVEVILFAATVGLAVGLSRTPPPAGTPSDSPAQDLLGYPMPGPLTAGSLFDVYPDPFFPALAAVAVGLYLVGVRRLTVRGVRWPPGRTMAWLAGWTLVLIVTSTGLARYGPVLNSVHMIQHMTLSMIAPVMLVLAGPLTLALRALRPASEKGTRGPREWLQVALHSRAVLTLSNPLIALALYMVSLYGMYFTGLYELTLRSHAAHLLSFVHFLAVGSLFFWLIIGIDPAPRRVPYPARVLLLIMWVAFHTIFSLVMMQDGAPLAPEWFAALQRPWGPSPLADQRTAGGIAWGFGDIPIIIIIGALVIQWIRADERDGRRLDRAAARAAHSGRAEDDPHEVYNAYLRELHEADAQRDGRSE